MLKKVTYLLAAALLGSAPILSWAGISSFPTTPTFGAPSYTEAQVEAARGEGRTIGRQEAAAECIGDPANCGCVDGLTPCGIQLDSVLTAAQFGETEPNDHIVAADQLIPEKIYWGQSSQINDQDWYYFLTTEPNQTLNLHFTVSEQVANVLTHLPLGWLVQVRDAAGNIYAQFDPQYVLASAAGAETSGAREVDYPIFLEQVGTYYVVIQPQATSVLYLPYNIAAVLGYSDIDSTPQPVNFFDAETEPNNTSGTADPLTSSVTMYGMLHANLVGDNTNGWALQTEEDWFWINSAGSESVTMAFCEHEDCDLGAGRDWRITVMYQDGTVMTSFRTDNTDFLRFGLELPGVYFVQVVSALKVDEEGRLVDMECKEWSTPVFAGEEAVCLSYAQVSLVNTQQYNFTWFSSGLPPYSSN